VIALLSEIGSMLANLIRLGSDGHHTKEQITYSFFQCVISLHININIAGLCAPLRSSHKTGGLIDLKSIPDIVWAACWALDYVGVGSCIGIPA